MNPRFLFDTNTFIYIRQNRPSQVRTRFEKLSAGEAAISVITYGELIYGVEKSLARLRSMSELEELTSFIPVLPLPVEVAPAYGAIRRALEAKGVMIGSNDLWIAAHAKVSDLTVVTNNEREFRRVSGLKVQNWVD